MARVFVTRSLAGPALGELQAEHAVAVWTAEVPPTAAELRFGASGAEGLLCTVADRIDAALLDAAPRLRVIANYAVGTDNVDLAACAARGIAVGTTPDVLTDATADLTLALLLAAARHLPAAEAYARDGRWRTWEPQGFLGLELRGAHLVLVGGNGRIGRAVAARAAAFGMTVEPLGRGAELAPALARADVLSLHAPLTPATHHLIDAAALRALKAGAILVNTGRGGLVDQAALIAALESGRLAAAALDVSDPEPPAPGDPLLAAPNLILLPHVGSATHAARAAMTARAVANLRAGLAGRALPFPAA